MKPIAYIRVSTTEQGDSQLGIEAQVASIRAWMRQHGDIPFDLANDVASGKNTDSRPMLAHVLDMLTKRKADTLVVAKLDRLGRSLLDLITILELSRKQGWNLVALDIGLDTSTPAGEAMFGMMAVWSQLERRMISQRTKEAMAQAKILGTKSGKPIGRPWLIPVATRHMAVVYRKAGWSYERIGAELHLGWSTVRRICDSEASTTTPRLTRPAASTPTGT